MIQSLTYLYQYLYISCMSNKWSWHPMVSCQHGQQTSATNSLRHLRPIPLRRVWDGKVQYLGETCSATHPTMQRWNITSNHIPKWFLVNTKWIKLIQNAYTWYQITAFPWHVLPPFSHQATCNLRPEFWVSYGETVPTRSRGMSFKSAPCFRNTAPAVWFGFKPTPSFVMTALVDGLTWIRRRQRVGASLKSLK